MTKVEKELKDWEDFQDGDTVLRRLENGYIVVSRDQKVAAGTFGWGTVYGYDESSFRAPGFVDSDPEFNFVDLDGSWHGAPIPVDFERGVLSPVVTWQQVVDLLDTWGVRLDGDERQFVAALMEMFGQ